MTNQKHTPGPWHYHYEGFNQMSVYSNVQTKCGSKGVVNHLSFYAGGEDEQKANARLIAAAPEILFMLKEARDFISEEAINYDPIPESLPSILDDINSAIDKAEGRG